MSLTRTVNPQYKHELVVAKGPAASNRVSISASVKDETASLSIVQGSLVSLDSTGKYVLGLPEGSGNTYPMPMFSEKNITDPDVQASTTDSTGAFTGMGITGGIISAFAAIGSAELETTEYDATITTYAPGTALVAKLDSAAQTGKVTAGGTNPAYSAKTIVGIVSRGLLNANSSYQSKRLAFFPVFIPAYRNAPEEVFTTVLKEKLDSMDQVFTEALATKLTGLPTFTSLGAGLAITDGVLNTVTP